MEYEYEYEYINEGLRSVLKGVESRLDRLNKILKEADKAMKERDVLMSYRFRILNALMTVSNGKYHNRITAEEREGLAKNLEKL